uniref:Peptidase M14 domain-containing protein n=1 Tax=Leptobrachium leishanense TaxID=445787 RepID=A0A8C5WB19_9ANUR
MIDQSTVSNRKARKISLDSYDYTKYHPMGEIGYPSDKQKKSIVVDCGIHAREWIAVAFCQWLVREVNLRQNNKYNSQTVDLLPDNLNLIFLFEKQERLWRKNRSPHDNGACYGVDLNRNFDARWCTTGASPNCSTNTFCGPEIASELESQGLIALINPLRPNVLSYLTIHSYGQYILLPHGYTRDESQNHQELMDVANKAAAKMLALHGKRYTIGSTSVVLYNTSGNSADWTTDINIKFSYTYELRDNGTHGFLLPEDQIKDTCDENTLAVMSMLEHINENYLESNAVTILSIWLNVIFSCAIGMYFTVSH